MAQGNRPKQLNHILDRNFDMAAKMLNLLARYAGCDAPWLSKWEERLQTLYGQVTTGKINPPGGSAMGQTHMVLMPANFGNCWRVMGFTSFKDNLLG
jgi:hypothetical protein